MVQHKKEPEWIFKLFACLVAGPTSAQLWFQLLAHSFQQQVNIGASGMGAAKNSTEYIIHQTRSCDRAIIKSDDDSYTLLC
jgi:hypothetical protein